MTYEDEIISQLSREVLFVYHHQKEFEAALINVEKTRSYDNAKQSVTDMAIQFPQVRSLGLLINLHKDQLKKVIENIFENNDQLTYILHLTRRISSQKNVINAFSYVYVYVCICICIGKTKIL